MARLRGQTSTVTTGPGTIVASTTAPASPHVGQRWYNTATAVTYQYTSDGASSFWLDISSGGIGTSASRGVDFVGDTDPIKTTNGTGLAVGSVYYNREKNRHFICTNATPGSNIWSGRYSGVGGSAGSYTDSNNVVWRWHKFTTAGDFVVDASSTLTVDILVIAGGGSGGTGGNSGGGGGAGALIWSPNVSLTTSNSSASNGVFPITVGVGGAGHSSTSTVGNKGNNSTFDTSNSTAAIKIIAEGGGAGGAQTNLAAGAGGSSGGGAYNAYPNVIAVGTSSVTPSGATKYGNTGSTSMSGDSERTGSGGGAGGVGHDPATTATFYGGPGLKAFIAASGGSSSELLTQDFLTGSSSGVVESSDSNKRYIAGGGGGQGHNTNQAGGLGGGGDSADALKNTNLGTNTGSGGHGKSTHASVGGVGLGSGDGAAGLVIVRYAL